jgi:hypothetical protein
MAVVLVAVIVVSVAEVTISVVLPEVVGSSNLMPLIYDGAHQNGIDFLVMKYLEGETLA